jgi:UDP-GlcNAc:undecaprenyl-phosphate GlcNAc-1-phosphate transferase
MVFLSTLLISMFITIALIPILSTAAVRLNKGVDHPEPRKVHGAPVPKVGGVALGLGVLLPMVLIVDGGRFVNSLLIGSAIVACFGLIDDLRTLGWKAKFGGQLLAALVVILYGELQICSLGSCLPEGVRVPWLLSVLLTLVVIVGVTNAINLSDGLDGLAGGTSLLIFLCIGFLAYSSSQFTDRLFVMTLCAAVIGAIIGFLRFNTYPASVFMGDTGSQLLGFLAITLALGITQRNNLYSPLLPLLLLGFPVLDTLTVMAERIASGRSPFSPDKSHFHHKLLRLGLFHTEAVVFIYAVTALLVGAAYVMRFHSDWLIIGAYALFAGLVLVFFEASGRSGFRFHRAGYFDVQIKGRLKILKDKKLLIRACFPPVAFGVPALFAAAVMVPAEIPGYFALLCAGFAAVVVFCWTMKAELLEAVLRIAFYLTVPLVLRMGQVEPAEWIPGLLLRWYHLSFGLLAVFVVMTLKFTRRQKGFKANSMDFLIVLIALVVPNLPDPAIRSIRMGDLAVWIIVMFFALEVLFGELRGRIGRLAAGMLAALVLLAARGLTG